MAPRTTSTRETLLDSALTLIWSQSYGGVSVDEICKAAKAKKGSFYHYFDSKASLTCAALEHLWEQFRPALDKFFSTQNAPLDRLEMYVDATIKEQVEMKKKYGYVIGCPFTSIASEQCSCKDGLQSKSHEILARVTRYISSAIRDAVAEGSLPPMDTDDMAQKFLTYELGALSYARVKSDLKPLEGMFDVWMRMAGKIETGSQSH